MTRPTALFLAILAALLSLPAPAEESMPLWPLDLDTRYLTGNFMEPRGGRYHTGLDLKTNSRTGYAVLAVRDGWISRVKLSEGGYGKAIYLRGHDGLTYVYGHLDRLADGLRERVRAEQQRRGAYALDLALDSAAFPVRRGEVLALSGQSATTGPHLHFEVRGPDGAPLDPLAHGFAVDDTMAPEILAVRAIRRGEGEAATLRWGEGDTALAGRLPDLFLRDGEVAFTARVVERSDRLRYRLGAWRLRLLLDGREVFASRNDRLAWRHNRQQRLEYLRTPLGQERRLWRDPRVDVDGRAATAEAGGPLAPGRHRLRLEAEDRAGNRSAVEWVVEVDPSLPEDAHPGWEVTDFLQPPPWRIADAAPGDGGEVAGAPGLAWRRGPVAGEPSRRWYDLAGLAPVDGPVEFRLAGPPLLDPVTLPWPSRAGEPLPDAGDPTLAVYRLDDEGWEHETGLEAAPGGAVFSLDAPGVLAVLRDVAAPVIATAPVDTVLVRRGPERRHGITLPRWPVLRVPVGDHGSGVDWETVELRLDGRLLVAEPDPPRDRLLVELPDGLAPGRHELAISVSDRAGHRRERTLPLRLEDPAAP